MEYAPKASDDELIEPGTNFDTDIGSIRTNIVTRVYEVFSRRGGVGERGDRDKCFVELMVEFIAPRSARLACRKEKARGGSSPSTPRVISSSLMLMLLTSNSSVLQAYFVSRNRMVV